MNAISDEEFKKMVIDRVLYHMVKDGWLNREAGGYSMTSAQRERVRRLPTLPRTTAKGVRNAMLKTLLAEMEKSDHASK